MLTLLEPQKKVVRRPDTIVCLIEAFCKNPDKLRARQILSHIKLISFNIAGRVVPQRVQRFYTSLKSIKPERCYYCPVCEARLSNFNPVPEWYLKNLDKHGYVHSIFATETLNIFDYECPSCGATDRDRLYALYLRQKCATMDGTKKYEFRDFGPHPALSEAIRSYPFLNYRGADLFKEGVDDQVDITNMPIYKDDSIDIFICSHVLEHVEDDGKAIAELHRILKPGGWGIVMVPIMLTLTETHEDSSLSESERCKYFGQASHVRIYSKQGFVQRLERSGFQVSQFGIGYFGAETFQKCGIHPRSVLYVVEKPDKLPPIPRKLPQR
jgi:SAM-dependent methyltransferase